MRDYKPIICPDCGSQNVEQTIVVWCAELSSVNFFAITVSTNGTINIAELNLGKDFQITS